MRIHLAADHAGYRLGRVLEAALSAEGHETVWHGADDFDDGDDFPAFAIATAQAVVTDEDAGVETRGILVGATGAGEALTANKVDGARAIPALDAEFTRLARAHSDANVLTLGAKMLDETTALALAREFVSAAFLVDPDDVRRIMHAAEFESAGTIEGWNIEQFDKIAD